VFPSRMTWNCHELEVSSLKTLCLTDMTTLEKLGVDASSYRQRRHDRTQSIADAAFFLGFDGLAAPSARWNCQNLVVFTDRVGPSDIRTTSDRACRSIGPSGAGGASKRGENASARRPGAAVRRRLRPDISPEVEGRRLTMRQFADRESGRHSCRKTPFVAHALAFI
jgi:hypothetical protein